MSFRTLFSRFPNVSKLFARTFTRETRSSMKPFAMASVAGSIGLVAASMFAPAPVFADAKKNKLVDVPLHSTPPKRPDLRTIPLAELQEACTPEKAWTSFKGAVYDITNFQHGHPGGRPRLMMAAGNDLLAFWSVYPEQHLRGHVVPWLEKLRIGTLSAADAKTSEANSKFDNYYLNDPERHPDCLHSTHHPFNGEPRIHLLTDNFYTPNELHYCRLHLNVPDLKPEEWRLEVSGVGVKARTFTLDEIKSLFPKHEVVNTLQCAGNRREDFHTGARNIFIGPHWVSSAFSNAKWGGARMRDVLAYCGLDVDGMALGKVRHPLAKHAQFESYDASETGLTYGASVPMDKVVDALGDVLVAYEMNNEDIPRDHGYPVRALIPGHAGCRSAKFLNKIIISDTESQKPWQIHAYRHFAPDITFEDDLYLWTHSPKVRLDQAQIIQELPVQSLVCNPPPNAVIGGTPSEVTLKGVAHGWGKGIARVDVSIDGARTLTAAELWQPDDVKAKEVRNRNWSWTFFEKTFQLSDEQKATLKAGKPVVLECTSKAVDRHMNVQPEWPDIYYNARGVAINHMYRFPVVIDPKAPAGVHIPLTGPGCYEGFGNVPTGGSMMQAWKVGPWPNAATGDKMTGHFPSSTFNHEKDTSSPDTPTARVLATGNLKTDVHTVPKFK